MEDLILAPVVVEHDGRVVTSGPDVAQLFEKRHDHVLRDIGAMLKADPECLPNFGETPYVEPSNSQTYRSYEIDRDGFMLLAMGFARLTARTGQKLLRH